MVGLSLHGLMGVDAELQQSAFAAQQQRSVEYHSFHVLYQRGGDCHQGSAPGLSSRT